MKKWFRRKNIFIKLLIIIIKMLNARIAEKSFIFRDLQNEKFYNSGFSNNLQAHQRFTKNAQEKIGHLIDWRPLNHKNSADRLMQLVKEYSNIFTELVEIYQKIGFKDWGLLGQWRRAIHSVEAQIAGMNRADMQESLLQLRILETVDLKAVTVSKNYVDKIIESMVLSPAI